MNVLMFGWEFPPNISGGLGTACYGIVSGLASCSDVKVTFIVPKSYGNEQSKNVQLISAESVPVGREIFRTLNSGTISFVNVSSKLVPYLTPESFSGKQQVHTEQREMSEVVREGVKIRFSGKYGPTLFDEISNYAIVAKAIAQENQFDLIHAHDWLTFPAAVAAKQISGKPLVIHVHSTDFDRSGGAINPAIFAIEKQGMDEADKIITVSNLTKKRLIDQYQIPSEKITTVYNAIEPEAGTIKTDFWDVHAMADAVHGILKYKKLIKTLAFEGKKEVETLNWENSARVIRQVYLSTLNKQAC